MTVVQKLEIQEEKAWNAYLDHSRTCSACVTFYAYCPVAAGLLKTVRDFRDAIGWGPDARSGT
ncbi:hypothetical protein P3L51_15255 [Streptomyces sp. PSRA5]|uniref:hypothetical protein n=1 Tax=Streptomyces panacea TaxID=3035064 RepID=UPI00339C37A7